MPKKARLDLHLDEDEFKKQIEGAAAKQGMPLTLYCSEAIEERLIRDGERPTTMSKFKNVMKEKLALLARMDKLREEIGPVGSPTSELVKAGRRR